MTAPVAATTADPVVEGFAAFGPLAQDPAWGKRLAQKAEDIIAAGGPDHEADLARLYLDAETEMSKRHGGTMRPEDVRSKLKPTFMSSAKDHPVFSLLFVAPEAQFVALASALFKAYAEECRAFIGPRMTDALLRKTLDASGFPGMKVSAVSGIEYNPVLFRSVSECVSTVSLLLAAWYRKNFLMMGVWPSRRAFERAYHAVEDRYAFLPAMQSLLGATPNEVLTLEKSDRLHALETETTTQARSIRAADEGLRRQADRLERTVAELEETKRKLEAVSSAKSAFIDVVSHQFRTPLSSVRWNAEMLYDEVASKEGADPAHKEAIGNIRTKSVYLIETLDRVFTTLEIDTGALVVDKKPAFLWELVQDVYGSFERDIKARGLQWKFKRNKDQVKEVPLDKTKIGAVLKIIIGNAVGYNKEGGKVLVDIAPETRDGKEFLVCSVADEGLGVPAGDADKFFEKFYRSKDAVLKVADGTGLGNYIVRHVIEAHGGWVRVESDGAGKGMTVRFALPTA